MAVQVLHLRIHQHRTAFTHANTEPHDRIAVYARDALYGTDARTFGQGRDYRGLPFFVEYISHEVNVLQKRHIVKPFLCYTFYLSGIIMANSRGRRTLRRQLQEAGLGALLKPIPPALAPSAVPLWKKIPSSVYAVLGALAVLIAILQGYPWLSLQEGPILTPKNPYTELFSVSNTGYVPVTDLDAICSEAFHNSSIDFSNSPMRQNGFAKYLPHGVSATLPCFSFIKTSNVAAGATLDVDIEYSIYPFKWAILRKRQSFHFRLVGDGGSAHWKFLAP